MHVFLGDKMKPNFDRFKRHLVPKISTLKTYQTRALFRAYDAKRYLNLKATEARIPLYFCTGCLR